MSSAFLGVQLAIAMARREMDAEGIDCSKVGIVIELPHNEFRRFLLSAADYQRFAGVPIDVEATELVLMGAIVRRQAMENFKTSNPDAVLRAVDQRHETGVSLDEIATAAGMRLIDLVDMLLHRTIP